MLKMTRLILVWTLAVLGLGGCASQPRSGGSGDYAALYSQGRYSDAYDSAVKVAGTPKGGSPQAALIAGLSAQALNRNEDAARWLTPLVDHADPNVAGKSGAALGLIAKERGENSKAAMLLEKASSRLQDDDAARALMYAGDAKRSLRLETEAHALYLRARDKATRDVALKGAIAERLVGIGKGSAPSGSGNWSVQAGVFSSAAKAQAMMRQVSSKGPARLVTITKGGQRLYYVRVGRYATKAEADLAKRNLGSAGFVVDNRDER